MSFHYNAHVVMVNETVHQYAYTGFLTSYRRNGVQQICVSVILVRSLF